MLSRKSRLAATGGATLVDKCETEQYSWVDVKGFMV